VSDNSSKLQFEEKPQYLRGKSQYFTGRKTDILKITQDVLHKRIVTISGEGGLGKTALAVEVIWKIKSQFDLIIPIYFDALSTYDDILRNFARRLDIQMEKLSNEEIVEIIQNKLNAKTKVLIFLDNYENISRNFEINKATEVHIKINNFFETMCEKVHFLLTSRYKNNFPDEKILEIGGLNDINALELFVKLSRSDVKRTITKEEEKKIQDILKKIGGHALSIEILARNYRGHDIKKLEEMMKILSTLENPRSSESRLKSLNACFDYSLNYLEQKFKTILFDLSRFQSPTSIKFLEKIFDISAEDLEILYEHSLLQRIEEDEFGTIPYDYWLYDIHPAERNYLEEKRSHDPSFGFINYNKVGIELGRYINFLSKDLTSGGHVSTRQFLLLTEAEDNDLVKFGNFISNENTKAQYFGMMAIFYERLHEYQKALKYYEFLMPFDGHYPENLIPVLANFAGLLLTLGEFDRSEIIHTQVMQFFEEKKDLKMLATGYGNMTLFYTRKGDWEKAYDYGEKAIELNKRMNNLRGLGSAYLNFGIAQCNLQKFSGAIDSLTNAEKLFSQVHDKRKLGITKRDIGNMYSSSGNHKEALKKLNESMIIFQELKDEFEIAIVKVDLGIANTRSKQYDIAEQYFSNAKKILDNYPSTTHTIVLCERLGNLFFQEKKFDRALEEYLRGFELSKKLDNANHIAQNSLGLGSVYLIKLYVKESFFYIDLAIKNFQKIKNSFYLNLCKDTLNILIIRLKENEDRINNLKDVKSKDEFDLLFSNVTMKFKEFFG